LCQYILTSFLLCKEENRGTMWRDGDLMLDAKKLKKYRQECRMTQKQIADILGISQQAYAQYESGKRSPKIETTHRIATALKIPPYWIDSELVPWNDPYYNPAQKVMESDLPEWAKRTLLDADLYSKYTEPSENGGLIIHKPEQIEYSKSDNDLLKEALLDAFECLNIEGQNKALERIRELAEVPKYSAVAPLQQLEQPAGETGGEVPDEK
jgi:transcriptional regulator with XRE-family HTH domain